MSADDFRTRLLRAYDRSPYAVRGNGGVVALARAAGVHPNTAYEVMAGKRRPTCATRRALLDALETGDA